jgi:hypothetical protein
VRDDIDAAEVAAEVLGSPSLDMGDQADQGAEDRDDGLSSRRAAKEALEAAVESLDRGSLIVVVSCSRASTPLSHGVGFR